MIYYNDFYFDTIKCFANNCTLKKLCPVRRMTEHSTVCTVVQDDYMD